MSEAKGMFSEPKQDQESASKLPWLIAGLVVVLAVAGLLIGTRHKDSGPLNVARPLDPYAASLALSKIAMSEAPNRAGSKLTYIDGTIKNTGTKTVTGATVQVLFANDENMPPEVETVQLLLIRSREPYIDTQTLAATPLKPGEERDFRLIFEGIGLNWNQQIPAIHVTQVESR